jgi:hypothetical protein
VERKWEKKAQKVHQLQHSLDVQHEQWGKSNGINSSRCKSCS